MTTNSDLHELLAKVASLYYEEELTQNAIAARLGLSRVKIYRLLKQAKDEQVVQIVIDWPIKRAHVPGTRAMRCIWAGRRLGVAGGCRLIK